MKLPFSQLLLLNSTSHPTKTRVDSASSAEAPRIKQMVIFVWKEVPLGTSGVLTDSRTHNLSSGSYETIRCSTVQRVDLGPSGCLRGTMKRSERVEPVTGCVAFSDQVPIVTSLNCFVSL